MTISVMKFGGGILKDAQAMQLCAEIVRERREKKQEILAVVSALNGVTDSILAACNQAATSEESVQNFILNLKEKHNSALSGVKSDKIKQETIKTIDAKCAKLERILYGVAYTQDASPKLTDNAVSYGERLSAVIFNAYIQDTKTNSVAIDADDVIVTNSNFQNAHPLMKETKTNFEKKIKPLLKTQAIVFTGFFGATQKAEVATLGRGGSDYTAGLAAGCLAADVVEIWKDVSGFLTTDPRVVPNAKLISALAYEEAQELGYFGSKILHPRTIEPLVAQQIPIEIRSVYTPKIAGTVISNKAPSNVKAIATKKQTSIITVEGGEVDAPGFAALVFSKMNEAKIPIDVIATAQVSISFTIDSKYEKQALEILSKVGAIHTYARSNMALLAIVGTGLKHNMQLCSQILQMLSDSKIPVELISMGGREISLSLLIPEDKLNQATTQTHKLLIGE